MAVYWIMFGLFAFGAFTWHDEANGKTGLIFLLASILTILVIGLRWEIGPDWETYRYFYERISGFNIERVLQLHDPGYYLINWALASNGVPFWGLNLLMATIFFYGLAAFCRTLPNPWLAITVAIPYLVIVVGMNLSRQAAAMGFVFLALRHVGTKPLWRSVAWVLVGSMFHASAIIVAFLIGISYSRNRLTAVIVLMISAIPIYYVLFATLDEYLQRYSQQLIDSGGVYFRLVINAVPAIMLLTFRKNPLVPPHEYTLWRNIAILSLLLLPIPLFIKSTTAVDRASMYAIPLQLMVLSSFPRSASLGTSRYANVAGIIAYSAATLLIYFSFGTHARYFAPYQSIFSGS